MKPTGETQGAACGGEARGRGGTDHLLAQEELGSHKVGVLAALQIFSLSARHHFSEVTSQEGDGPGALLP